MAFSYTEYTGNGSTRTFTFGFTGPDSGYIRSSDIRVLVDGSVVAHSLTSSNTLELATAPPSGSLVQIRRVMPKDSTYTTFSRGNKFGEDNMNNSFLQTLYTVHEFLDGWFPEGFRFLTDVGFASSYSMEGNDITDVGTLYANDVIYRATGQSLVGVIEGIADDAQDWAMYPYNQPVPSGNGNQYSALHWATVSGNYASDALGYRNTTLSYMQTTLSYRNAAQQAVTDAQAQVALATQQKNLAQGYANDASDERVLAEAAVQDAEDARDQAQTSESNAAGSASSAETYKNQAMTYRNSAESFKNAAGSSATSASGSASAASTSASQANTYRGQALAYRNQAEDFRDEAEQFASQIDPNAYAQAGNYTGDLNNAPVGLFFYSSGTNVPAGITAGMVTTVGNPTGTSRHQSVISSVNGSSNIEYVRKRTTNGTWSAWTVRAKRNLIQGGYWGVGDVIPITRAMLEQYDTIEFALSYLILGGTYAGIRVNKIVKSRLTDFQLGTNGGLIDIYIDNDSYAGIGWDGSGSGSFLLIQNEFYSTAQLDMRVGGVWGINEGG